MTDASTTSRPLFNRQQLISLFLPLVAEQALSISIGLADTLMVSSVGEAAVSGVSLVDSFNVLMIQLLSALATGGAVVASQYIGHREPKRAKASAAQIMFIMISLSVVTAVIVAVGRHAILRGIFGSIDADVMRYAETYFLLSALSYPFIGVYNAGAALFRAQGNSKISMLSSLVMNVVNIGGNAILIYGFGMGVMGAATASLVSRMIACFTVMFLLQKPDCALRIDHLTDLKPDLDLIKRILKVGIPAGIENGMFQIGKLSVSSLTSTLGTAAIAANAVAGNISSFLNVPASAVGIGALTVVGQCLGAGEKVQAMQKGTRRKKPTVTQEPSVFSGRLKCPECGGNLNFHFNQKNHNIKFFSCQNHNSGLRKCSATHYIRLDFLEQVVLYEVNRLAAFANEYERDFVKAMMGRSAKVSENDRARKQRELNTLLTRDKELDMLFERLYEDNVAGKIDDTRFARMSKRYEQEQGEIGAKVKTLRLELKKAEGQQMDMEDFLETVRRYTHVTKITRRMVSELIDHIDVYHAEKQDGVTNQRVVIYYNCIGAFDVPDRRKIPEATLSWKEEKA